MFATLRRLAKQPISRRTFGGELRVLPSSTDAGRGRAIAPGETVRFDMSMPSPARGAYILEFDLLSESVTWFSIGGTQVVRVSIEVT